MLLNMFYILHSFPVPELCRTSVFQTILVIFRWNTDAGAEDPFLTLHSRFSPYLTFPLMRETVRPNTNAAINVIPTNPRRDSTES